MRGYGPGTWQAEMFFIFFPNERQKQKETAAAICHLPFGSGSETERLLLGVCQVLAVLHWIHIATHSSKKPTSSFFPGVRLSVRAKRQWLLAICMQCSEQMSRIN